MGLERRQGAADNPPPAQPGIVAIDRIDRALKGTRWLRFEPELEKQFTADSESWRRNHQFWALLLSILLYESFLATDAQFIPDIYAYAVQIRLSLLPPALLAAWFIRRGLSPLKRELFMSFTVLLSGLTIISFQMRTNSPHASHYYIGLPLIIIYGNTIQRLRFWFALVASSSLTLVSAVCLSTVEALSPEVWQAFVMVMAATATCTLAALYKIELDERNGYLMRQRERVLLEQLGDANTQLYRMTRTDPLTGIANRRGLDEQLASLWEEARERRQPLSLMMLDVDCFKAYNDRYGHPAGDKCLKRVAAAINTALRHPADYVARFGGEEFVAILPNTAEAIALQIAERVRRSVITCDILHESSSIERSVTVSIGLVTMHPDDQDASVEGLLKTADLALYDAKVGGRNRVEQWQRPLSHRTDIAA